MSPQLARTPRAATQRGSAHRVRASRWPRPALTLAVAVTGLALALSALAAPAGATPGPDGLGVKPGKIKHVFLIIMENKSYDATFTGLNKNTYLWKTLPEQGALLKNYYGTGHFSQDNYIAMVSGQAPITDTQVDCPFYDKATGALELSGKRLSDPNYGQFVDAAGPNGAAGTTGCVYPKEVETVFNQFDAAKISWKGYAQDLNNADESGPKHSAGVEYCGAPYAEPGATGNTSQPNPGSANGTDQYVPKHFPFPWFESLLQSGDCNSEHIANVFDAEHGLYHDLQNAATTPQFVWISPNNCSDAHDAVCHGNNLSGGFKDPNTPNEQVNYTGGLYAGDLFLEHVIPEIEESAAFKEGGLIDVTFDEGFPPFTFTGNSFENSTLVAPTAATSIASDTAGETLFGNQVNWEPTGPNTPLEYNEHGEQLYPGPGYNAFIDRPNGCVAQTVPSQPAGVCILGGASHSPGERADAKASAPEGSSTIADNAAVATDRGRTVTGTGIPAGAYVGEVSDSFVNATESNQKGGFVDTGSFALVNGAGEPLSATAAVSGVKLGARTNASDPLFTSTGLTNGGGDTGSVLISPYIKPGSVSTVFYNHYSWLRTMEDLFAVRSASAGIDKRGHLGYAAQPGLAPFGADVFTNPAGK